MEIDMALRPTPPPHVLHVPLQLAAREADPARPLSVLVTGATGVVGRALLKELADLDVTCLVHRTPPPNGTKFVTGDITQDRFGLDAIEYEALVATTDAVVHCAALTHFGVAPEETDRSNVLGTQEVLHFAERAGAAVYHVSTAFVRRQGATFGRTRQAIGGSPEPYLRSKCEAEDLVRASAAPTTIVRPSVVIGDRHTGEMSAFQGLHTLAGAIVKGQLPMLPARADARVDVIPQDVVARALATLVRRGVVGGEYWLTAGRAALTVQQLIDVSIDVGRSYGKSCEPPRLVAGDVLDRLVLPLFEDSLPPDLLVRFDELQSLMSLFQTEELFPSSLDQISLDLPLSNAVLEEAFTRSMHYWAEVKGLRPRLAVAAS
jgi:thioester reductase-like protein